MQEVIPMKGNLCLSRGWPKAGWRWGLLALVGLVILSGAVWAGSAAPQSGEQPALGAVSVSMYPASVTVKEGDEFYVSIYVSAGTNQVNAIDLHLAFDPTYLQVTRPCKEGTALPNVAGNQYNNAVGSIDFGAYRAGGSVSGNFFLCTIYFRAKRAVSETLLTTSRSWSPPILVLGPNAQSHTASWRDGRITILAPTATPTATATPTETPTPTATPTPTPTATPTPLVALYLPLVLNGR
jgi:hypothetical protein